MGIYEHQGRLNVRYYDKDGNYVDHGRMIYEEVPKVGDIVSPFYYDKGKCQWKVLEVRFPEDDPCMEVQFEDIT